MARRHGNLTDDNYEFIKGEVIHFIIKYNIKLPVSGFELAAKMGIGLVAYSSLSDRQLNEAYKISEDGYYLESNGQEFIFYNDIDNGYERLNWTLLHEIAHCVLDHTGCGEYEEEEADFFAKYAIAPPVLVKGIGATSPFDIWTNFNISFEAAVYAYDYYRTWNRKHLAMGCYTDYEIELIDFACKTA